MGEGGNVGLSKQKGKKSKKFSYVLNTDFKVGVGGKYKSKNKLYTRKTITYIQEC